MSHDRSLGFADEEMISTFAPLLKQNGMPNHAIVDTGRNAVTGLRAECEYHFLEIRPSSRYHF